MRQSAFFLDPPAGPSACALLWDGSFLWGVMAWQALGEAALPCSLVTAAEIRQGALDRHRMLFVPGGWAAQKEAALGKDGCRAIRCFVEAGGSYLGICGGAGLATREGLGLLPVSRRPAAERVASFSGGIVVETAPHPLWQGVAEPLFSAWWPSQLAIASPEVRVLASYGEAHPSAFSADIPVGEGHRQGWADLEARYGILLDPARLEGEPAVVEGRCGRGRVILSLLHFDTPGDAGGRRVLQNLWQDLAGTSPAAGPPAPETPWPWDLPPDLKASLAQIRAEVDGLIAYGEGLCLWRWRHPFLLQWRRGVRGLEYSTLAVMIREVESRLLAGPREAASRAPVEGEAVRHWQGSLRGIQGMLTPFCRQAKALLAREARCLERGVLSPLHCDDEEVRQVRQGLFGTAMRHGGSSLPLLMAIDRLWLDLVRTGAGQGPASAPGEVSGQAAASSSSS